ncbi:hypothetical protein SDJN02_14331 [Cucurbita argyrosperma subsp. argyrosperma]|uniref:Uncharacterized protein LOC111430050 n=1 Tax=Cucurbita moschata TaxID=3662 RepID=A0A6J1E577_CUCMO|nr:uncharacterized protein LOC111430050 [Cucurbita moschata]KAG7023306.1 hypothetical protein SDJN02_14331 [Cucurbita argyrosperma subsp. argyrosperma]
MLGTALQFGGIKGEDRFYIPVRARKSYNQQKPSRRPTKTDETETPSSEVVASTTTPSKPLTPQSKSNLERFLDATKPSVPAQYFSKTTMRGWRTCDIEFQPYFVLNDLWESFKEWSAYGAGVPLVLNGGDSVVQYYVPYLSGIQIYGESAALRSDSKSRLANEDSDLDSSKDTSSEGSIDYEFGKSCNLSREQWVHHHLACESAITMRKTSLRDEHSTRQEGFSSDDGDAEYPRSGLLFQFLEQDLPYQRVPLADKIFDLAYQFPGLKTLRSCDILPASWISVAWYPIYRIPTGPTLKDLDACFLTYHSLSTPIRGNGHGQAPAMIYPNDNDGIPKVSLPVFGLASYKLKGSIWAQNCVKEHQMANSLMQAAEKWLRRLQVNQPDFQFFASHMTYWR